jgi:hypothetical protein
MAHSTSYRRMLNKMGYYSYQSGLIYRHLNQENGWDSHLARCRDFIIRAMDIYKPEKITVLGSGWLLELPIAEMIERSVKVSLIDIVHPPDVIAQAGSLSNVELVEADITGGLIEEVWNKSGKSPLIRKTITIDNIVIPEYTPEGDQGMVISLNILTQLESLLIDFLKRHSKIGEEEFFDFRSKIQRRHIDFLKRNRSVLISDTEEIITDKSGSISSVQTLATELPEGLVRDEWTWNFDQTGADFYSRRSVFKVIALAF